MKEDRNLTTVITIEPKIQIQRDEIIRSCHPGVPCKVLVRTSPYLGKGGTDAKTDVHWTLRKEPKSKTQSLN